MTSAPVASRDNQDFLVRPAPRAEALAWLKGAGAETSPGGAPQWIQALRATGAESFAGTGLPDTSWEGWQFTPLQGLSASDFHLAPYPARTPQINLPPPALAESYRLVIVNGQFFPSLSDLPDDVKIVDILQAETIVPAAREYLVSLGDLAPHPFKMLNAAHVRDGFALALDKGRRIDRPIEVVSWTDPGIVAYPRMFYWLDEGAEMTVIERCLSAGKSLVVAQSDMVLNRHARLHLTRFSEEDEAAFSYHLSQVHALRGAVLRGFVGAFGGGLSRQEWELRLLEPEIESTLAGIYLKDGRQIHDFTVRAEHFDKEGRSAQHFRGVVDDKARAVFQGKIHVHRPAQKTDGYQSHHALLLSPEAEVDAKPELEIYADDVKCSHGATSGQLDREALFYLQSRGIDRQSALSLLLRSFLADSVMQVDRADLRDHLFARIDAWLARRGEGGKSGEDGT